MNLEEGNQQKHHKKMGVIHRIESLEGRLGSLEGRVDSMEGTLRTLIAEMRKFGDLAQYPNCNSGSANPNVTCDPGAANLNPKANCDPGVGYSHNSDGDAREEFQLTNPSVLIGAGTRAVPMVEIGTGSSHQPNKEAIEGFLAIKKVESTVFDGSVPLGCEVQIEEVKKNSLHVILCSKNSSLFPWEESCKSKFRRWKTVSQNRGLMSWLGIVIFGGRKQEEVLERTMRIRPLSSSLIIFLSTSFDDQRKLDEEIKANGEFQNFVFDPGGSGLSQPDLMLLIIWWIPCWLTAANPSSTAANWQTQEFESYVAGGAEAWLEALELRSRLFRVP